MVGLPSLVRGTELLPLQGFNIFSVVGTAAILSLGDIKKKRGSIGIMKAFIWEVVMVPTWT